LLRRCWARRSLRLSRLGLWLWPFGGVSGELVGGPGWTYVVADGGVVLGGEGHVWHRTPEGEEEVRELSVDEGCEGWHAEEGGKKSEDTHDE
jgi:hypothetical protein